MMEEKSGRRRIVFQLAVFFCATFVLSWGVAGLFIFLPGRMSALVGPFGDTNPLYYFAVYCPSLCGIALSLVFGGWSGIKRLFSGISLRANPIWYLAVFVGYPAIFFVWHLIDVYLIRGPRSGLVLTTWLIAYPMKTFLAWPPRLVFDPGPVGEEFGWRGFALPRLLTLSSPLTAALVLGFIWAVWHFPAYLLGRKMSDFPFFLLFIMSASVIMTWLYLRLRGNFLIAGIFMHWTINGVAQTGMYVNFPVTSGVLAVAALVLVLIVGRDLGGYETAWSPRERFLDKRTAS